MKKTIFSLLFTAVVISSFGQSKELKSANRLLKKKKFNEAKELLASVANEVESSDDNKQKSYLYYLQSLVAYGDKSEANHKKALEASKKVIRFEEEKDLDEYTLLSKAVISSIKSKYVNAIKLAEVAGKTEVAGDNYINFYHLFPQDTTKLLNAVYSFNKAGNNEKAIGALKEILAIGYTGIDAENKESKSKKYFRVLLTKYIEAKQNDKVLELLEQNPKMVEGDDNMNLQMANMYYQKGNKESYIKYLIIAADLNGKNADMYYNIGNYYHNTDKDKAINYYKKAIDVKEDYLNAYMNIGSVYLAETNRIVNKINANLENTKLHDSLNVELKQAYVDAAPFLYKAYQLNSANDVLRKTLVTIYKKIDDKEKVAELEK